jgi:hypothetical protein
MVRRLVLVALSAVVLVGAVMLPVSVTRARAQEAPEVISDNLIFAGKVVITADGDGDVPNVDLVGGGGAFAFAQTACLLASNPAEVGPCTIAAAGGFVSIVCGTGNVFGGVAAIAGAGENVTLTFGVAFAAGIGVLTGNWSSTGPDDGPVPDNEPASGLVLLLPAGGAPDDAGDCAPSFNAVGMVQAREVGAIGS